MSTLTISSPGVQINEVDLSIISRPTGATDVLITGFASQGPTEDLVNIGSLSEFESIYGTPTNAAERYLYHSAKEILTQSTANLMVSRIPYGSNLGEGYANSYSALVYQISSNRATFSDSTEFKFLAPVSVLLTEDEYFNIISDNINWQDTPYQYINGGLGNIFGTPLTNATSAIAYGQRIYGIDTIALSSLPVSQALSLGFVNSLNQPVSTLSQAYFYINGEFLNYQDNTQTVVTGVTNIFNAVSAAAGLQALNKVYNYLYSYEQNPTYQTSYGDSTIVTELTSYALDTGVFLNQITSASDIVAGKPGLIILNTSKTAVNDLYEGYYLAIADNSSFNPSSNFDSIQNILSVNGNVGNYQNFATIPQNRLNFSLTQSASSFTKDSLSKIIEQYPIGYDFSTKSFNDSVVLMLFKIKSTQYSQDTVQLDYSVAEGYAGSFYAKRTQNNPYAGTPISFNIDTVVNNASKNIKCMSNPYFSNAENWLDNNGVPAKKVSMDVSAKAAYANGVYINRNRVDTNDLGRVDLKLSRILDILSNDDSVNIDIVADAGLSSIWASAYAKKIQQNEQSFTFNEMYIPLDVDDEDGIGNKRANVVPTGITLEGYQSITNKFITFAEARKDHVFVSDPLRTIFVRGTTTKVSSKKNFIFSNEIYWPLNNIYNSVQSSYTVTYGNWMKTNDVFSTKPVWVPSSGYATAIIAKSSQTSYPWVAPAGFSRGTLANVLDIAINPTQKQRDLLYKINVNPVAYFNTDGFVIYGQKTMYRKPSAFDRINVRRLFLTLEKATQRLLKYYVFEPNDFATRNRLKGALTPIFDQAKLNDGCYDYLIVCDTTNNTPDVIDNNQLKISIYIQPVRAAEFILADFIATRTGVNFSELIAGGQS
jgi:hypothetical protein